MLRHVLLRVRIEQKAKCIVADSLTKYTLQVDEERKSLFILRSYIFVVSVLGLVNSICLHLFQVRLTHLVRYELASELLNHFK